MPRTHPLGKRFSWPGRGIPNERDLKKNVHDALSCIIVSIVYTHNIVNYRTVSLDVQDRNQKNMTDELLSLKDGFVHGFSVSSKGWSLIWVVSDIPVWCLKMTKHPPNGIRWHGFYESQEYM